MIIITWKHKDKPQEKKRLGKREGKKHGPEQEFLFRMVGRR
jgi:hypothetical protein